MTSLTVTAYPDLAAVLVTVTGAPAGPVTLTRTDANGTNLVRLLPDQEPISGTLTVYDYEPALAGDLVYDVLDAASGTDTATLAGLDAATVILSTPLRPAIRHSPLLVTDLREDSEPGSTVHQILDRDDPVAVLRPSHSPAGFLTLLEADYAAAAASRTVLTAGAVVQLRQPTHPGLDRYLIPGRVSLAPAPEETHTRRWQVTVDYAATSAPTGPLAGAAGWDFAALTASAATFTAAQTPFATFADLTVGP